MVDFVVARSKISFKNFFENVSEKFLENIFCPGKFLGIFSENYPETFLKSFPMFKKYSK